MATTKDLSALIDREMGKGQGPFLVRICQDARLLPKVRRGGWRSMKELTPERLADFVIAIAGTRAVGERNANGARAAVERFAGLVNVRSGKKTLRDTLAALLQNGMPNDVSRLSVLFVNHPDRPEVEVRQYKGKTATGIAQVFNNPSNDLPDGVAEASVIYGMLIEALHDLVTEVEETAA